MQIETTAVFKYPIFQVLLCHSVTTMVSTNQSSVMPTVASAGVLIVMDANWMARQQVAI